MASLNKVLLVGNLTRDPEVRYTPKGTAVGECGLAINEAYTQDGEKRERVTFVDVTLWGKTAENVGQYCHKGTALLVEGRLQLDQWDDKESGQKRSKLKVVGDRVQFLGGKTVEREAENTTPPARHTPTSTPPAPAADDDRVPF
jgi:single-strand DNA-binding protein